MKWIPIRSRALRAVAYDAPRQTLAIEFVSGSVYEYLNVPEPHYHDLLNAESKGTYFTRNIRDSYAYRQLR